MNWNNIVGNKEVTNSLKSSLEENRVSHAQLFTGKEGYGTMAIALAYASEILCDKNPDCQKKTDALQHADLHLSFPTFNVSSKQKALSGNYINEFREFIMENPYASYNDWNQKIDAGNKQGIISVDEMETILHKISLKSFEGGYKVMLIWNADKMHNSAANKFLKMLEEPPAKTVFILITEKEQLLLPTITSRCQTMVIPRINDEDLAISLAQKNIPQDRIQNILKQAEGDWNNALHILQYDKKTELFEALFATWTRNAFMAKKNPTVLKNLADWAQEISKMGREEQKTFLQYCTEVFRQALLKNYQANELVFLEMSEKGINLEKFSYYIHGNNIEDILEEISQASYEIERNVSSKIVLLDLAIKLTRFIHRKSA